MTTEDSLPLDTQFLLLKYQVDRNTSDVGRLVAQVSRLIWAVIGLLISITTATTILALQAATSH